MTSRRGIIDLRSVRATWVPFSGYDAMPGFALSVFLRGLPAVDFSAGFGGGLLGNAFFPLDFHAAAQVLPRETETSHREVPC